MATSVGLMEVRIQLLECYKKKIISDLIGFVADCIVLQGLVRFTCKQITDRSYAVILLWVLFGSVMLFVCSLQPCGHLLGKG